MSDLFALLPLTFTPGISWSAFSKRLAGCFFSCAWLITLMLAGASRNSCTAPEAVTTIGASSSDCSSAIALLTNAVSIARRKGESFIFIDFIHYP
jgi:hypothetical protein